MTYLRNGEWVSCLSLTTETVGQVWFTFSNGRVCVMIDAPSPFPLVFDPWRVRRIEGERRTPLVSEREP